MNNVVQFKPVVTTYVNSQVKEGEGEKSKVKIVHYSLMLNFKMIWQT